MHTLPKLPYDYNALEPYFDEATMRLHHTKHHQTYIDKLNAALEKHPELAGEPIEKLLADLNKIPDDIRTAVRNHGGGHANHTFWWPLLTPPKNQEPEPGGELKKLLDQAFGSFADFKKQFTEKALGNFGSGWTWLVDEGAGGELSIINTPNQDSPISQSLIPVLGLDVWEHAYYLKYQNRRPEYVEAFIHLINWPYIDQMLAS